MSRKRKREPKPTEPLPLPQATRFRVTESTAEKIAIGGACVAGAGLLVPIALEGKITEGTSIDAPYAAIAFWVLFAVPGAALILRAVGASPAWPRHRYGWTALWVAAMALASLLCAVYGNVGFDRSAPVIQRASFVRRYTRAGNRGSAQSWTVYRLTDGTELTTSLPLPSDSVEVYRGAFGTRWYRR